MSEKKVGKRLLTWVLVLVMTLSLLPLNVLADEATASNDVVMGYYNKEGAWTKGELSQGKLPDGVKSVNKTAVPTTDAEGNIIPNQYDVTLTVELEQTKSSSAPGAAATVLVIDLSGSMNGCASCKSKKESNSYYHDKNCTLYNKKSNKVTPSQSRMDAAKEAAKSFIMTYSGRFDENDNETTTENLNLGRWVCLVWFNTTGGAGDWLDVSNKDAYQKAINTSNWNAQGGTNLDCGLKFADHQLKQNAVKEIDKSLKNVVVLTDGKPTYYLENASDYDIFATTITIGGTKYKVKGDGSDCDKETFQTTKSSATNLKKSASVYTVCFGASGDEITNYDDQTGSILGWPTYSNISVGNYLKDKIATPEVPVTGTEKAKIYAYDAGNTEGLMNAFAAITKTIVSGLNSGTVTDRLPTGVTFKNGTPDGFTSTSEDSAYKWELSGATGTEENGKTVYTYTTSYTVIIDPETAEANADGYVPLNGKTTLTVDGGSVDFPIPAGKVTPKTLTLTATGYTGKYDGQKHEVTAKAMDDGQELTGVTYKYSTDEGTTWVDTVPSATDVTDSKTVFVRAEKRGYNTVEQNCTLTITPVEIELKADSDSREYDGTELVKNSYTINTGAFVGDEGLESVTVTGSQTNAGSSDNEITDYKLKDNTKPDNYNITTVEGTLTITPVAIELTANSDSKKYDGTALTADGYTISNGSFVGEEGLASVDVEGSQTAVGSSSNTITSYTLKDNTLAENYTITYKPGTLEVTTNDEKLTVSASGYTGTYDGRSYSGTVTPSLAGATIQYSTDDGATWAADEPTITNVGTITVKVKATLAGYKDATCSYTLEVTPKDVTVKADDKHVTVGASAPEYTATVTGTIDDDTVSYTLSCNEYDPETAKAGDGSSFIPQKSRQLYPH